MRADIFNATNLEDIGVSIGDIVTLMYIDEIIDQIEVPAEVDVIGWVILEKATT